MKHARRADNHSAGYVMHLCNSVYFDMALRGRYNVIVYKPENYSSFIGNVVFEATSVSDGACPSLLKAVDSVQS